jgi:uncharacterized protein (TIGR02301 family)
MQAPAKRLLRLGFVACSLAAATLGFVPVAEAQFWPPWFDDQPRVRPKPRLFDDQPRVRPKPRPVKPVPAPGDDLPPIVPKEESSAPPPPDDRPYDNKLLRLAEILGAVHYLRELCGAQEGQLWRDQMKDILKNEGSTAVRRAKLVNSFNDGYRGYRRTYRTCTPSATVAVTRFSTEGAQIAAALVQPSHAANRGVPAEAAPSQANQDTVPQTDKGPAPQTNKGPAPQADKGPAPQANQAKAAQRDQGAAKPKQPEPGQ